MTERSYAESGGSSGVIGCAAAMALLVLGLSGAVFFVVSRRAAVAPTAPVAVPSYPVAPPVSAPPMIPGPGTSGMGTPAAPSPPQPGTIGLGNLGTIGGEPPTPPPPAAGDPVITPGSTEVRGALSRDVIRGVVRRHLHEVQSCYEQGLGLDAALAGRVVVSFVIGASGVVQTSSVASSTLASATNADEIVHECVVRALRTWMFPEPDGGGIVAVNYPFVLEPSP